MKNNWLLFKKSIDDLNDPKLKDSDIKKKWSTIQKDYKNFKPNHLIGFLKVLSKNKITTKSCVLDHGCGNGLTLFFLALNGYQNIWGIDINNSKSFDTRMRSCNKVFKVILKSKKNRIQVYNGKRIPFRSEFFNFIFSQQVIEHVKDNLLNNYLSEERRTLSKNGAVLHQIPHRLGPYEGHTNKWIIHWFPKNIHHYLLKNEEQKLLVVKKALFLKWPWQLKFYFKKYFNQVDNVSFLRLKYNISSGEYSKKEKVIRKVLVFIFNVPVFGKIFLKSLSVFFQLEILAKK